MLPTFDPIAMYAGCDRSSADALPAFAAERREVLEEGSPCLTAAAGAEEVVVDKRREVEADADVADDADEEES